MDLAELQPLLDDDESDRAERTVSLKDNDKFCEAICAFANDMPNHQLPGYLFVGAKPDGTASGAEINDQLLQNLAAKRSEGNIQPSPAMNVQKCALGGGEMAVVEVFPSDLPPIRYKGQVWIRVGPSRRIANAAEEHILIEKRVSQARTWDALPCREARLSNLALDLFALTYRPNAVSPQVIEANDRSMEEQLAALRFYDTRHQCPTHAAMVLFAKNPLLFMSGAYVQFVSYDGPTQADEVLWERRSDGDLLTVLRGLDQLALELAGAHPVRVNGLSERIVYAYPPKALHELLVNAIIHRNYESTTPVMVNLFSDRLELLSPGGLYGDLTPEQFPQLTAYRNPIIAEAAKVLGFVNRFGRGIALAQSELLRNGSPPAEFTIQPNHFLVTVRKP